MGINLYTEDYEGFQQCDVSTYFSGIAGHSIKILVVSLLWRNCEFTVAQQLRDFSYTAVLPSIKKKHTGYPGAPKPVVRTDYSYVTVYAVKKLNRFSSILWCSRL